MSEKIKVTEKELKSPDKFRTFIGNSLQAGQEHFKTIIIAFISLIIVVVGISVNASMNEKKSAEASYILNKAVDNYSTIGVVGNVEESLNEFKAIIDDYSNTEAATLAFYYSGAVLFENEIYDAAIKHLEKFLSRAPKNTILTDYANLTIGMSNYHLGNWEKSIDSLNKLEKGDSPYRSSAIFHISEAYKKLGQHEKAKEIYNKILETL